jgi:signal peptidase II
MKWGAIAVLTVVIDQICKWMALRNAWAIHKNFGIAFDLAVPSWVVTPIIVAIITGAAVYAWKMRKDAHTSAAFIFIALGGVGNLIDRLVHGYIIDYIIIGISAINIADLMVIAGVAYLLFADRHSSTTSVDKTKIS